MYVKRPLSKRTKIGFQDQLLLNAGQKYCRMLYFLPSLSYHLSLRSLILFCLFLSGRFTQALLYVYVFLNSISVLNLAEVIVWFVYAYVKIIHELAVGEQWWSA